MANKGGIEIELEIPKPEVIEFVRLSKKSEVYFDSWRQRTYCCQKCKAIVVSTTDHTRFHQDQLDMMIAIAYRTIPLEELRQMVYQPRQINPLKKSEI